MLFLCLILININYILQAEITAYQEVDFFLSDPEPVQVDSIPDLLNFAAEKLGMDFRNFNLPRAYESNYRFTCRLPVIDQVANNPLFLKQWSDDNALRLNEVRENGSAHFVATALEIIRGSDATLVAIEVQDDMIRQLQKFQDSLRVASFTAKFEDALVKLFGSCLLLSSLHNSTIAELTADEWETLYANPAYYLLPDGRNMPELTGDNSTQLRFIELLRKLKFEYIFSAAIHLETAVKRYIEATAEFDANDFISDPGAKLPFIFNAPFGIIKIAGTAPNIHEEDVAILIDIGGNDIYRNNAGSNYPGRGNLALCIDHHGDDVYSARERKFVQGTGFLGAGFLIDLEGNDRYNAEHFSQGTGIAGVGLLWDRSGNDAFYCNAFCQGAGMFGAGFLLDDDGSDKYDCATLGQGAATTLGLGIISDLKGDDNYLLSAGLREDALGRTPGYGQGGAVSFRNYPWDKTLTAYGGVGMLLDRSGDDVYKTRGWCDQGGSYIMSLGVLVDDAGNDIYSCHCGQGSGIHITSAILIDRKGDDSYSGEFRAGGSGGDRSPGIFIDCQGNDVYSSHTSSYGTGVKPFSYSLFIDYQGEDTYICNQPGDKITFNNWESFGGVWPESEPHLWPYALCFDLGGEDRYMVRNRANNSFRHSFGHGLHLDTETDGNDIIGIINAPLAEYADFPLPEKVMGSDYFELIAAFQKDDTFARFQNIGKLTASNDSTLFEDLVTVLKYSTYCQFNRDMMECIDYYLTADSLSSTRIDILLELLQAYDPEVRILIAQSCGTWKFDQAEDKLWGLIRNDPVPSVRRFALSALRNLESKGNYNLVRETALGDSSGDVRRIALYLLADQTEEFADYFRYGDRFINDTDPSVRIAFVRGLASLQQSGMVPTEERAEVMRMLYYYADKYDYDAYLQRAIGAALCEFYEVRGIAMLINSLSFPSIDAFENYNRNVPNQIALYANHDIPEELRYNQQVWLDWFNLNSAGIDLKQNVFIHIEFLAVRDSLSTAETGKQINAYEAFLTLYPGSHEARNILAELYNREAWDMVTADMNSERFDPALGISYANRAVQLEPQLNYIDTQAEAYLAAGEFAISRRICEEVLLTHPDSEMFRDRLERIDRLENK